MTVSNLVTYACVSDQGLLLFPPIRFNINLFNKKNDKIQYYFILNAELIAYLENWACYRISWKFAFDDKW